MKIPLFLCLNCLVLMDSCQSIWLSSENSNLEYTFKKSIFQEGYYTLIKKNRSKFRSNEPIKLSMTIRQVDSQELERRMMRRLDRINQKSIATAPLRNRYNVIIKYRFNVSVSSVEQVKNYK